MSQYRCLFARLSRTVPTRLPNALPRRYLTSSDAAVVAEPIIGRSKEAIEQKKRQFEEKYRHLIEKAAREKGLKVEELKAQAKRAEAEATPMTPMTPLKPKTTTTTTTTPTPEERLSRVQAGSLKKQGIANSPIKPLTSILDVEKLIQQQVSAEDIGRLWLAGHASSKATTKLGAVVPIETYKKMTSVAKQCPEFVVPLPREVEGGRGAEIIFLQWAFLPSLSDTPSSVHPSTVLFTSLAAYKAHGTFAQPALCLTHYTDLADSHGIVFLRGEISIPEGSSSGNPMMTSEDAQLLCLRLQQHYGGEGSKALFQFHGKGEGEFDLDALVKSAWDL